MTVNQVCYNNRVIGHTNLTVYVAKCCGIISSGSKNVIDLCKNVIDLHYMRALV